MVDKISNYILDNLLYKDEKVEGDEREIMLFGVTRIVEDIPKYTLLRVEGNESGYIIVNSNMETCVDGLFAAGDVTNKKLKQIVTATGDGALAATSVIEYLRR